MRGGRRRFFSGLAAAITVATALAVSVGVGSAAPARAATASTTRTGSTVAPATTAASTTPTQLPGTYVSLTPARILDTSTGTGAPKQAVAANGTIKVAVLGHGGLPSSGVAAVAVNLTVASATAGGYLTAYPDGTSRPGTSTLNFTSGVTVSNLAFLKVPASGVVDLYNGSAGTVRMVGDVKGYFVGGTATVPGAYVPLTPQRILDTGNGTNTTKTSIGAKGGLSLNVHGLGGVPSKAVDTVTLNVTVAGATATGWLSAYDEAIPGHGGPANSFTAGRSSASLVTVRVTKSGLVGFYNSSSGSARLVADVEGYTLAGPTPLLPTTVPADTELGDNQPGALTIDDPGANLSTTPDTVAAHGTVTVTVPTPGFPFTGVGTAEVDVTTDGAQTAGGYLTAYATGSSRPATSDLNFAAGQAVTSLVLTDLDRTQHLTVYNGSASAVRFWVGPVGFYNQQRTPSLAWAGQIVDPPRGNLTDVSCPSLGSCTEADQYGNAVAQTANGWGHALPLFDFDDKGVQHVSCPTTTFCVAAGIWGVAVEKSGSWSPYVSLETNGLVQIIGLSCASSSFCLVADDYGQVFTWNGATWSGPAVPDPNGLTGISCPSAGVCFGVDETGAVAQLSSGSWHVTAHVVAGAPNSDNGDQISCPTTAFCEATSSQDAATYSGGVWHASTPISFASSLPFDAHLSCASATLCMFAASGQQAVEWTTTDGHTWTAHPSALLTVRGLDCLAGSCLIVGSTAYDDSYADSQTQTFTGSAWAAPVVSDPDDDGDLVGASCPTTTWCMANDHGHYLIDKAGTWTWPAAFPAGISAGADLHCVSASYCTVDAGQAVATWRGSSWTLGPKVTNDDISQLSCPTTTFCMAVDQTGAVFTYNGSVWKPAARPASGGPAVLDCASSTFCVGATLVNTTVQSYRWSGSSWTTVPVSGSSTYPQQMACPSVGSCVLLLDDGTAAELNGAGWSTDEALGGQTDGAALACVGTDTCQLALGQEDLLPVSDGWTGIDQRLFLPGNVEWGAISCASIASCIATNSVGVAYTGTVP
jgi:hypothetical protein